MRVKRGTIRRHKHKKMILKAKGYQGRRKSVFKLAKQAVLKAGQYSYRDRRNKKRLFRSLWIIKINAALSTRGQKYSNFINMLKVKEIKIDRKILADMAENNSEQFSALLEEINK